MATTSVICSPVHSWLKFIRYDLHVYFWEIPNSLLIYYFLHDMTWVHHQFLCLWGFTFKKQGFLNLLKSSLSSLPSLPKCTYSEIFYAVTEIGVLAGRYLQTHGLCLMLSWWTLVDYLFYVLLFCFWTQWLLLQTVGIDGSRKLSVLTVGLFYNTASSPSSHN
jgi:hypothetical protein